MTEFRTLQTNAAELYSNEDMRKWLFTHTRTEGEYAILRHALETLAEFKPVQWTGPAGHREPVPMEA